MQTSHQIERMQVEDAHRRELASEAKRAEILQQTNEALAQLTAIGQDITTHLDAELIFAALNQQVRHLFELDVFTIYVLDASGENLHSVLRMQQGQVCAQHSVSIHHLSAYTACCARERRELIINLDPQEPVQANFIPDSLPTFSALFAPLILADRVLGVMTIQSARPHAYAYGAREQMIFRILCAYTAIALSNADAHSKLASAHRQVVDTQKQMVMQEKMAGLGTLTAGVAHEINNPTNFVHVAAQNQRVDLLEFQEYVMALLDVDDAPQVVQGFTQRFAKLAENVSTMLNGTERLKGIVKDLRSFTRLDEAEKKSVALADCLYSTLNLVRTSWLEKVDFVCEFASVAAIECWPALLNQVFMNLLVNGCQAIEEQRQKNAGAAAGRMCIRLYQQVETVVIEFEDNGIGIEENVLERILEPFFHHQTSRCRDRTRTVDCVGDY